MNKMNSNASNSVHISNRIYYEITSVCNLNCIHCSDMLQEIRGRFLPCQDLCNFHQKVKDRFGINSVVLTGGEPTLHPEFFRIIEILAPNNAMIITTNGINIDCEKMMEHMKKYPNILLQISMDGLSKEVFESIQGKDTYNKLQNNIQKMLKQNLQSQLGVSMTILKQNIHEVMPLIKYAQKAGFNFVHFPVLLSVGKAFKEWNKLAPSIKEQINIENQIFNYIVDHDDGIYISSNRLDQIIAKLNYGDKINCLHNPTLKIDSVGNVHSCPASANTQFSLGSIYEEGILDKIYFKLQNRTNINLSKYDFNCQNCIHNDLCSANLCSNCRVLQPNSKDFHEYTCSILKYHFSNAKKDLRFV